ncbi:MAG TPA: hypothetical protein VJ301_02570 [Propionibacteriaceae bacterium]|nr:hypothetical protein [Propionibacteriaceae bacterium]
MMERRTLPLILAVTMLCAGCTTSATRPSVTTPPGTPALESRPAVSTSAAESTLPTGTEPVNLNPADFTADISHRYWPMKPGTRWTYRDVDEKGEVQDVVIVATTATKKLANGITARVVRDTVRSEGDLVEDTFDWYAQDSAGNVWYLGENTAEFENGKIVTRAGSFEAGAGGALPGILLPAEPQVGQKYRQEYLQGEAEDNGEVLGTNQLVEVPTGRYSDALLTRDTTSLEPTVVEYKLYAPGIGPVLALDISGGASREELVKIDKAAPTDGTGPLGKPNP